jgi:hypothetical protein
LFGRRKTAANSSSAIKVVPFDDGEGASPNDHDKSTVRDGLAIDPSIRIGPSGACCTHEGILEEPDPLEIFVKTVNPSI